MALFDNGAQINTIMPKYVSGYSLQMGLITDLLGAKVTCMQLGNAYTRPLGYVVIQVQVDWVQGYDEDKIALVILDLSNCVTQIPVILGNPTISWVINVMKEAEIDALEVGDCIMEEPNPDSYDQVMFTQNVETIEPFSSHMVPVKVGRAHTGEHINIMVQACGLKMALCYSALLYKTCTQNWGKEVKRQSWW